MTCRILTSISLVLAVFASIAAAYPQDLVYYPPPTQQPPVPSRTRREVSITDSVSTNLNGGQDVGVKVSKVVGNEKAMGYGEVFASGNTKGGDTLRGATIGAASNGLSASVTKAQTSISDSLIKQAGVTLKLDNINTLNAQVSQVDTKIKGLDFKPQQTSGSVSWKNDYGLAASVSRDVNKGISDTLTKSVAANLFQNNKHSVDGSFFKSNVALDNGVKFDKTGGLLSYSHANGHGLNAGLTRFSGIGRQASVGGHANLFTSSDGFTKLNANAGATQWLNGPFSGQRDYGFGLGLSYNGWRG